MATDDSLSDDDKKLFQNAMRGVKPLHTKSSVPSAPKRVKKRSEDQAITTTSISYYRPNPDFAVGPEEIISFQRSGVNKRQFSALKQAKYPFTASLDLHGLNPDAAAQRLTNFISQKFNQQQKVVLIIHGKGGMDGKPPVIKNLVYQQLQDHLQVLAFHSAQARHGGTGALYVMLKQKRED